MNSPYSVHPASLSEAVHLSPLSASLTGPAKMQMPPAPNRLAQLLKLEGDIRQLPTWYACVFHSLNETCDLIGFQQSFFFRANNRNVFHCEAVSSVAVVDARAPLVAAMNSVINRLKHAAKPTVFDLTEFLKAQIYPHRFALWVPMVGADAKAFAGILYVRDESWPDPSRMIAERITGAYAHALRVHKPPQLLRRLSLPKWALYGLPLLLAAMALVPVPMTIVAPFEIVARNPMPITAPLDGVIKQIGPDANDIVESGTVLFQLDTTDLLSKAQISAQQVVVAEARLATAQNGAFADTDLKRSMKTLQSELDLAKAELDLSKSNLRRANVIATEKGLLIYSTKADWLGKSVRTGEKVMELADPKNVAARIDVNVHDAIGLDGASRVRLFLDADPLHPVEAQAYERSYNATEIPGGALAYSVRAELLLEDTPLPRIGLRGSAQLIGDDVALGYYLLRRPLSELRQYFGL